MEALMTKQRVAVLQVLRSDMCHHTAEEVFLLAREIMPGISRATVYNNLHALENEGFIRRISGDGGPDRYDNSYIPHGHLICTECGGVFDITVPELEIKLQTAIGSKPESYELKVKGVCRECYAARDGRV